MRTTRVFITSLLSAGLVLGSVSVAHADSPTPTATPVATTSPVATSYADQLAAYKVALAAYQVAMDQYRAALKAAKIKAISLAFQEAVAKARFDKRAADAAAKSPDQKIAADAQLKAATSTAVVARQNALDALGPELVQPTIPTKPVKSAEPIKPTPPVKTAATLKATTTAKSASPKSTSPKSNGKKADKNN